MQAHAADMDWPDYTRQGPFIPMRLPKLEHIASR